MRTAVPFAAINTVVAAFESLLGVSDRTSFADRLTARQRADIGMVEAGAPVILDPLIQILSAGRR